MVLFECSLDPSVSGWYDGDSFSFTPVRSCKADQNVEMKSLSQLEMSSSGRPFSQYQLSKNITASSSAVIVVHVGIIQMSELRLVIDKMQS